jgi:hypothetical protein
MSERRRQAILIALDRSTVVLTLALPEPEPRVIIWRRRVFVGPYRGQWPGSELPYFEFEPHIIREPPDTSGPPR